MTGNDGGSGGQADARGDTGETKGRGVRHEGPVARDGRAALWDCGRRRAGRGRNAVTRNVACELALIISYPELNFPSG